MHLSHLCISSWGGAKSQYAELQSLAAEQFDDLMKKTKH